MNMFRRGRNEPEALGFENVIFLTVLMFVSRTSGRCLAASACRGRKFLIFLANFCVAFVPEM